MGRTHDVAHRARIVHQLSALWWLVVGIAGAAVALVAGGDDVGNAAPAAVGALGGPLLLAFRRLDRDAAPPGVRLARAAATRRATGRFNAVLLAVILVPFAALATAGVWWLLGVTGLVAAVLELVLWARTAGWERERPGDLLVLEIGFWRPRQFAWRVVWGDQAPEGDALSRERPPHVPNPALAAGRFWPSRDPEDYR